MIARIERIPEHILQQSQFIQFAESMMWILGVILIFCLLGLLWTFYMRKRNKNVYKFLCYVNELDYTRASNNIYQDPEKWGKYYNSLPDYDTLMWKFWLPLELETFFEGEEVEDLLDSSSMWIKEFFPEKSKDLEITETGGIGQALNTSALSKNEDI